MHRGTKFVQQRTTKLIVCSENWRRALPLIGDCETENEKYSLLCGRKMYFVLRMCRVSVEAFRHELEMNWTEPNPIESGILLLAEVDLCSDEPWALVFANFYIRRISFGVRCAPNWANVTPANHLDTVLCSCFLHVHRWTLLEMVSTSFLCTQTTHAVCLSLLVARSRAQNHFDNSFCFAVLPFSAIRFLEYIVIPTKKLRTTTSHSSSEQKLPSFWV